MNFIIRIVVLYTILVPCVNAWAQRQNEDCEQTLNYALSEFNAGRFYSIPSILKPCLDNGFTREQRLRANILLTQIYLIQDDPVAAETSYLSLLHANPEFVADTALHPIDVVYFSKKFTAEPIFTLFAKMGGNTSPVSVIHTINPTGESDVDNNYNLRIGWQFGGGVDWNIYPELALTAELNFMNTSYKKTQIKFNRDEEVIIDRQNWIDLPISIKYSDTRGPIRPYGYIGFSFQWLLSDKAQITSTKIDDNPDGEELPPISIQSESPTLNMMDYRNKLNRSFFIGGGVRYKIGLDFVFADLRYSTGLTNLVVPPTTYASTGPMIEYGHADDYFRLNNLALSVGYVKPLYKPRKLKKARTKMVLRGINKSSK
ncbi:MAG: outer membrane beta-barrel protein [Cyclobacteriaceae bacterium]|jgi:hypothetical protein|nr:outer membrane beta-barrel protein [Cyclobacteriaceae bacterium]